MNVALVVPNFRWVDSNENFLWDYIPYNLCLLGAQLEAIGCGVTIIDAYKDNLTVGETYISINRFNPSVVGITCMMDQYAEALHLIAKAVKRGMLSVKVIVGGVYPTTNPIPCKLDPNIDLVVRGEGEQVIQSIVGGHYKEVNKILRGTWVQSLDHLPKPAYHLIDLPAYSNSWSRPSVDRPPAFPYARIMTSRGCPYKCNFCQVHSIVPEYKVRSAENILDEMQWLVDTYNIKSWVFDDDNLLQDKARALDLFMGMSKRGLSRPWVSIATPIYKIDAGMIQAMKLSGCIYVDYAIESGTERVLHDVIHKPVDLSEALYWVSATKAQGIFTVCNFIIGFPTETWDEIRQTLNMAGQFDCDYVKISTATPLRHTELWNECEQLGCFKADFGRDTWKAGQIETDEFTPQMVTTLRAYEWDRINFTNPARKSKIARRMGITIEELDAKRKGTLS